MPLSSREVSIHLALFLASCVTTCVHGALDSESGWVGGLAFSATLMGILVCHEAGHYFVSRRHGVPTSLPYFIPLPPYLTLGTMGAVIRMDEPISDRNALFDVGAAGPIAGLVVAIPLLVVGLTLSELRVPAPDAMIEGNSILYAALKYAVFGRWLPGDGLDVQLHPMALAGWFGLLLTMINLIPIGQLDGGHVARAALGEAHERWSARLHVALPAIGLAVGLVMLALALDAGKDITGALLYAFHGLGSWLVWALLLGLMRWRAGEYHPPVGDAPLDPSRRRRAIGMLIVFVLIATPVPFRPVL
ncbi:MAG TPA: site-2 protease family protein [Kofleriaceae bacterium]|nr:site-2 protease family protein [Kofleriaceae bacterium]